MIHASSDYPELYFELETELGDKLLNNATQDMLKY